MYACQAELRTARTGTSKNLQCIHQRVMCLLSDSIRADRIDQKLVNCTCVWLLGRPVKSW